MIDTWDNVWLAFGNFVLILFIYFFIPIMVAIMALGFVIFLLSINNKKTDDSLAGWFYRKIDWVLVRLEMWMWSVLATIMIGLSVCFVANIMRGAITWVGYEVFNTVLKNF